MGSAINQFVSTTTTTTTTTTTKSRGNYDILMVAVVVVEVKWLHGGLEDVATAATSVTVLPSAVNKLRDIRF